MKKVFLTGGTGLIGTQTIPLLRKAGFEILALTIDEAMPEEEGVAFVKANLFDQNALSAILAKYQPEYLLHYAWSSTGMFHDNMNFDFLTASINLLKAFAENGGKRAVMAGTYAEYGYHNEILKEDMPPEPINVYSQCKNFVREIAQAYCKHNGVSFGWGRIFSAFGKEKDPRRLTSDVINHLKSNEPVIIRSGSLIRDYIYTKDIAAAFVSFLDGPVEGIVNICTGVETSIHDYVMKIAKAMDREDLVIFQEQPSPQQVRVVGDCTRLNKEVGFYPKYSLEEAIQEILQ